MWSCNGSASPAVLPQRRVLPIVTLWAAAGATSLVWKDRGTHSRLPAASPTWPPVGENQTPALGAPGNPHRAKRGGPVAHGLTVGERHDETTVNREQDRSGATRHDTGWARRETVAGRAVSGRPYLPAPVRTRSRESTVSPGCADAPSRAGRSRPCPASDMLPTAQPPRVPGTFVQPACTLVVDLAPS